MNPFEKLLAQIKEWDHASGNLAKRRFGDAEGVERWGSICNSLEIFLEVDEILRSQRHTELLVDSLWEYFFQPARAWAGSNAPETFPEHEISHLKTHALLYETTPLATETLANSEVDSLVKTLNLIRDEIEEFEKDLGAPATRLLHLIDSCLVLLEQDDVDPAKVRAKAEQIVGAAVPVGNDLPEENKPGFWEKLGQVVRPWMRDVSSNAAGNIVSDVVTNLPLPPVS